MARIYQQKYLVECQIVSSQNNNIYQQNLEIIKGEEQKQENNLTKDALEVFGD